MIRVERAVAMYQCAHSLVDRTSQRTRHIPIHAVMDDQKIYPGIYGLLERDEARIHRGTDFRDAAVVCHLQSIESAGRIFESGATCALITIGYEIVEGRRHRSSLS